MYKNYRYTGVIAILVYAFTGLCACGAFHVSLKGSVLVGFSCILQGIVMFATGRTDLKLYTKRFLGSFIPAVCIVLLYSKVQPSDTLYALMTAMFMPIASGSTFVEGICHSHKPSGRSMITSAVLIALCLELGAFVAMKLGGLFG
ncbi:MAG: threonine/serine exporter family protein [Solobacterium sp.]|nr:threonine/serine exporter family protein [Solobacterium sp.]MBR2727852.1 threonine/serine exporter family protein [Solobacterium sp.]